MMRPVVVLSGVLGMSACTAITDFRPSLGNLGTPAPVTPAVAPAPQPQILTAKERLMNAIEAQGCELNAVNVGSVLTAAVITREELLQLTPQLQSEGRVEVAGSGTIRSTSVVCAAT